MANNDIDRLKSQLLISGLQQKDFALFQVINQLIDRVKQLQSLIGSSSSGGSGGGSSIITINTIGFPGSDGNDGADGDTIIGPPGIDGIIGPTGPMGAITLGPMGLDGIDGDEGMPIPGPIGLTGATGPIGPTGPPAYAFIYDEGPQGEDGFPGIPGADSGGETDILMISGTLTNTQILAMFAAPITIVSAVTGVIHWPIALWLSSDFSAGAYASSGIVNIYRSGANPAMFTNMLTIASGTTKRTSYSRQPNADFGGNTSSFVNTPLTISNATSAFTTGNAANTLNYILWYRSNTPI
jgi:hypothetical protein